MTNLNVVASVLFFFLFLDVSKAACYLLNGTDTNLAHGTDNLYLSCNNTWPGTQHSMCCRTGDGRDACLDNGMCQNQPIGPTSLIWRESCTDPTWQDLGCFKLFIDGVGTYHSAQTRIAVELTI